jgi:protein SCO1/2
LSITLFRCSRALALALAAVLAACDASRPAFKGTDVTGASFAREFSLSDPSGKTRTLVEFQGKVVTVFFGFTRCPDACPTSMAQMKVALAQLGDDAKRVQVVFITVDPERDTPEVLNAYVTGFDPSFLGLYGNVEQTAAVAKEFKVFYQKSAGKTADSYSVDHTAATYVFDPKGRLRLFLKHGAPAEDVAADLKRLLAGQ